MVNQGGGVLRGFLGSFGFRFGEGVWRELLGFVGIFCMRAGEMSVLGFVRFVRVILSICGFFFLGFYFFCFFRVELGATNKSIRFRLGLGLLMLCLDQTGRKSGHFLFA